MIRKIFTLIVVTGLCCARAMAGPEIIVNNGFTEIQDILYNPGIGLSDFHHQSEFPTPTEARPSGKTAYYRFYWSQLETAQGVFDTSAIDKALATTAARGQMMGLRIMSANRDNDVKYIPNWVLQDIATEGSNPGWELDRNDGSNDKYFLPDYDNPIIISAASALLTELGKRYGNHPNLSFVDVGMVGVWGEWHDGGDSTHMPSPANAQQYIDMHKAAFPKKSLVMLPGNGSPNAIAALQYAVDNDMGWRGDCWGDIRYFNPLFNGWVGVYATTLDAVIGADEAWKHGPVVLESCGPINSLYDKEYDIPNSPLPPNNVTVVNDEAAFETMVDFAIDNHVSSLNTMGWDAAIHPDLRPEIQRLARSIGYRFVLKSFEYPKILVNGEAMQFKSSWRNVGNAPVYEDFRISYRLRRVSDGAIVRQWISPTYNSTTNPWASNLKTWLPDGFNHDDTLYGMAVDENWGLLKAQPGVFKIDIAILWPEANEPAIALAINGRRSDGWYEVGQTELAYRRSIKSFKATCNQPALAHLVDTDLTTDWHNTGSFNCASLILERPEADTSQINTVAYKDRDPRILGIATSTSDEGPWTKVANCNTVGYATNSTQHHYCTIPATSARYLKVYLDLTPQPGLEYWMVPTDIQLLLRP